MGSDRGFMSLVGADGSVAMVQQPPAALAQRQVTARVLAEALEAGGSIEQAARLRRTEGVEEE